MYKSRFHLISRKEKLVLERKEYLEKLRRFKDKDFIRTVTFGQTMWQIYLILSDNQIIKANLEDVDYSFENYKDYMII